MASNWNHEMQDKFDELQNALTEVIARQTEALTLQAANQGEALASQARATEERLTEVILQRAVVTEERLIDSFKLGMEQLRETVRTSADNYGGVLDSIQYDLADFRREWREKTAVTDQILANHHQRISTLESARAPSP